MNDKGEVEKRRHIISPVSGLPVDVNKTISVLSESATVGEFLSTTLLILPEEDGSILLEQFKNMEILEVNYSEGGGYGTKLHILQREK